MDLNEALRIYNYVIVFKGGDMTIQSPIISGPKYKLMKDAVGGMHQFDPELVDILPAISYCLHLPRFECDTLGLLTPSFHEAMGEIS